MKTIANIWFWALAFFGYVAIGICLESTGSVGPAGFSFYGALYVAGILVSIPYKGVVWYWTVTMPLWLVSWLVPAKDAPALLRARDYLVDGWEGF